MPPRSSTSNSVDKANRGQSFSDEAMSRNLFFILPAEVLNYIFTLCQRMLPLNRRLQLARRLSLVCRAWGTFLQTFPDIWTAGLTIPTAPSIHDLYALSKQFTIDGNHRITVFITESLSPDVAADDTSLDSVKTWFAAHPDVLRRISHIEAPDVSSPRLISKIFPVIIGAMQAVGNFDLRTISLPMIKTSMNNDSRVLISCVYSAAAASTSMFCLEMPMLPTLTGQSCVSLTHLAVSFYRDGYQMDRKLFDALHMMKNLKTLTILDRRNFSHLHGPSHTQMTYLPLLSHLVVRATTVEHIDFYLSNLTTPVMHKLLVAAGDSTDPNESNLWDTGCPVASWPSEVGMQFLAQCDTGLFTSLSVLNMTISPRLATSPILHSNTLSHLYLLPQLPTTTPDELLVVAEQRLPHLRHFGAAFDLGREKHREWLFRAMEAGSYCRLDDLRLCYLLPHRHRHLALRPVKLLESVLARSTTRIQSEVQYPSHEDDLNIVPEILVEELGRFGEKRWGMDFFR
ncbi:hypothetical protein CYLTODRAFT_447656 [Cylindrobasidium torrendii FP15055 ss-10]|uniref:F-box domain-containing protein n=1 Tax=Cylindrobasidium torrendii FP15055 ss-10 TaxID=1314674 RepID=A0A0D7AWB0_9AGAR|nr:hypothetical protein CYLTODRAFT_447656 [Cylindrobasidium torrendii FP15055 ss-10]